MSLSNTSLSLMCSVLTIQRKGTWGSLQHTAILLFCCCHRGGMWYNMHVFVLHTENPWFTQYCCRSASEKLGEKVTFPPVILWHKTLVTCEGSTRYTVMMCGTTMVGTIRVHNKKYIDRRIKDKGLSVLQPHDSEDTFNK